MGTTLLSKGAAYALKVLTLEPPQAQKNDENCEFWFHTKLKFNWRQIPLENLISELKFHVQHDFVGSATIH